MTSTAPQDFSGLADRLVAIWEAGDTVPDLSAFLRDCGGFPAEQVVELCLIDQPFRWRTAKPLRVEEYLASHPALAEHPEHVFELLYGEVRTRQQLGQPPSAVEIDTRFPEHAKRLQQQLAVSFWMDEGVEPRSPAVQVPAICQMHHSGRFGPYELGEAIAHGGMGVIFRARDVRLNRTVALKVMRPDRRSASADEHRFCRETVTVAQLDHPHIVPIYDVGEVEGVHYFTMKLMEGGDLQQHCRRWLDDPRGAARVMIDVADAVHHAHQCGVLHRDVKPSNVLLDHSGEPFVTDFGLACRLDDTVEMPQSGAMMGTPAYLAPERLTTVASPLTVATDVYGLGAVLYVLLTGKPLFEAEHVATMLDSIRHREPVRPRQLNPWIDADLEQICLKALSKRPADRYTSAHEFATDLQRFLSGKAVSARPISWWERRWRWACRHPDLAALSGAILAAAMLLLSLLAVQTVRLHATRHSLDDMLQIARTRQGEAEANQQEAARLRRSAEQLQSQAEAAREEVVAQQHLARETFYAAAMHHTEIAWRAGDTVEFSRLLDQQVPAADQPDVRGFEWYLLDRLYRPRPLRLPQLTAAVRCVGFSPDGRLLAAAGDPGQIQIFDAASGRVLASWPSLTTVRDLAFSPDGTRFATVGDDGVLRLYPSEGGKPQAWPVAKLPVWHVAFVADSSLLATGDQDGIIRLTDHRDGQCVATWATEPGVIHSMAVAPDGQWLAGGDRDGNVIVWDRATQRILHQFWQGVYSSIKCLAISQDGTCVATGSTDNLVRVYRLSRPWAHEQILTGQHFDRLQRVAFSADGRRVAGCDKNGSVRVWRLTNEADDHPAATASLENTWQAHRSRAYAIAFDPRQNRLATGGHEAHVAVWSLENDPRQLALGETGRIDDLNRSLVFSPDGELLLAAALDGVQVWDWPNRHQQTRLSEDGQPRDHVAVSHDGRYLAAARDTQRVVQVWRRSPDGYQRLWETADQASNQLAFSPDGDRLVVASWTDDEVAVYDPATGQVERKIPAKQCRSVAFSPDGRQLAFTEEDDIVVWDWSARQPLRRLRGHLSTVMSLAFSPDGHTLASCGRDRRVNLWDAKTGELRRSMMGHRAFLAQVVFVGDDRVVSLGEDGTVLVWHAGLGLQLCSLHEAPSNPCFQLAVAPDQRWLAVRLADGNISVYDLARQ
jgi:eukaryotic-like serine/threonine-protein kinase